jgi:selenocysteine lyase/cysteine desulfurase
VGNIHHAKVAAILSYEYGIGVRNGCFCAHPFVLDLLNVQEAEFEKYKKQILNEDKSEVPGMVRISFGLYNTAEEIDRLLGALNNIAKLNYSKEYISNKEHGSYSPSNWKVNCHDYFNF